MAENCSGTAAQCPTDTFKPSGTQCRAAVNDCDVTDFCNGTSAACPDNVKPAGSPCGPTPGTCDNQAQCDGSGTCVDKGSKPDNTPCDDQSACSTDEVCKNGVCTNSCGVTGTQDTCSSAKTTGGGQFLAANGDKWSFGHNAQPGPKGHFNAVDHTAGTHINGDVTAILCVNPATQTMTFEVTTSEHCVYDVIVQDVAEPGAGKDRIEIDYVSGVSPNPSTCPNNVHTTFEPLTAGNIQWHSH